LSVCRDPICGQLSTAFPQLASSLPRYACRHRCADPWLYVDRPSTAFHQSPWFPSKEFTPAKMSQFHEQAVKCPANGCGKGPCHDQPARALNPRGIFLADEMVARRGARRFPCVSFLCICPNFYFSSVLILASTYCCRWRFPLSLPSLLWQRQFK
jgi:hypothetical protein